MSLQAADMPLQDVIEATLSKNAKATRGLARDLLCREAGERLPTSVEYQAMLDIGSGTLQKALRMLDDSGAVTLQSRGHQGTFLVSARLGLLWTLAALGPVTAALPPGSIESQGLQHGLEAEFDRVGVSFHIRHVPGAQKRLELVASRASTLAVTSADLFGKAPPEISDALRVVPLGPSSFYAVGSLVVVERGKTGQTRIVGIDRQSHDHAALTAAEFPAESGVEYVDCLYTRIPEAVARGEIDAGVWHRVPVTVPLELAGLHLRPLSPDAADVASSLGDAVLALRRDDVAIEALLTHLDIARVSAIQSEMVRSVHDASIESVPGHSG